MSRTVKLFHGLRRLAGAVCVLAASGAVEAAVGQSLSKPGPIVDEATFQQAARQQYQIGEAETSPSDCEMTAIPQAVALIYQLHNESAALTLAQRCELYAVTQSRPHYRTLASRVKALVAIKLKDMMALQAAGEALVLDAQAPEFVADGHLFIAFACTFSGRALCARTHLDQAKLLFERHEVTGAMEQLMSVEQALLKLESSPSH